MYHGLVQWLPLSVFSYASSSPLHPCESVTQSLGRSKLRTSIALRLASLFFSSRQCNVMKCMAEHCSLERCTAVICIQGVEYCAVLLTLYAIQCSLCRVGEKEEKGITGDYGGLASPAAADASSSRWQITPSLLFSCLSVVLYCSLVLYSLIWVQTFQRWSLVSVQPGRY